MSISFHVSSHIEAHEAHEYIYLSFYIDEFTQLHQLLEIHCDNISLEEKNILPRYAEGVLWVLLWIRQIAILYGRGKEVS